MPERLSQEKLIKGLFGRSHSIKVWGALVSRTVEPPEVFRGSDIVDELEIPQSSIFMELKRLRELGMIRPAPLEHWIDTIDIGSWDSRSSLYLERTSSPLWNIAEVAVSTFAEMFPQD